MATVAALGLMGTTLVNSVVRPPDHLTLVGSRALRSPVESWLELLRERYPNTRVHVRLYGSGLAASAMADNRADAAPMSRPLNSSERAILPANAMPVAIPVGGLPLASGHASPLYLYVARGASGRAAPPAIALARIALSQRGQSEMARAGFEPLAIDRRNSARAQLANLANDRIDQDY